MSPLKTTVRSVETQTEFQCFLQMYVPSNGVTFLQQISLKQTFDRQNSVIYLAVYYTRGGQVPSRDVVLMDFILYQKRSRPIQRRSASGLYIIPEEVKSHPETYYQWTVYYTRRGQVPFRDVVPIDLCYARRGQVPSRDVVPMDCILYEKSSSPIQRRSTNGLYVIPEEAKSHLETQYQWTVYYARRG